MKIIQALKNGKEWYKSKICLGNKLGTKSVFKIHNKTIFLIQNYKKTTKVSFRITLYPFLFKQINKNKRTSTYISQYPFISLYNFSMVQDRSAAGIY